MKTPNSQFPIPNSQLPTPNDSAMGMSDWELGVDSSSQILIAREAVLLAPHLPVMCRRRLIQLIPAVVRFLAHPLAKRVHLAFRHRLESPRDAQVLAEHFHRIDSAHC